MIFVLCYSFAFWCVLARMTTSQPGFLNERDINNLFAVEPEIMFSQNSDSLVQGSDTLFQDSDSLFQNSDSDPLSQSFDYLVQNSDALLPSDNVDIALQLFDPASANMCNELRDSLNFSLSLPVVLKAWGLANEIPALKEFDAPLIQLYDSTCGAPNSPQSEGSQTPEPYPKHSATVTFEGRCSLIRAWSFIEFHFVAMVREKEPTLMAVLL